MLEAVRGGTSRHLLDLIRSTSGPIEHRVALAAPPRGASLPGGAPYDSESVQAMEAAGARVSYVAMRRSPLHPANLAGTAQVVSMLRRGGANIVHGHSSVGGALARVAGFATGVPAVYTPNGVAESRLALRTERALGSLTARWVAVSASEAALARTHHLAPAGRVVVIPNGIDLRPGSHEGPSLRELAKVAPGVPLVGTVARLVPQKDPLGFVALCAKIAGVRPDVHFALVGMGPMQGELDEAVRLHGLGGRWHQIPYSSNVGRLLGDLDVFVLLSRFEGGPYTPLEAMRCGTPVVLSDVVGNRDAVLDGQNGFLVPLGDTRGAADATLRLLDDGDLRQQVRGEARMRLETEFALEVMGQRLLELYKGVSEQVGGPPEPKRRRTRRLPHPRSTSSRQPPEARASE